MISRPKGAQDIQTKIRSSQPQSHERKIVMSLWYADAGPYHVGQEFKKFDAPWWCGMDNQERFNKNMGDAATRKRMERLGWTDPETITYSYNHQSFRSEEFDDRPAGVALGCSHTMGTGNRLEQTWPWVLSELLGMHVWNLGVGSSGLDTNLRLLDHYIKILRPRFVVHAVPSVGRFEFFSQDKWFCMVPAYLHPEHEPFRSYFNEYYLYDENSEMNARRNLLAIRYLCQSRDIPYFALDVNRAMDMKDRGARDLIHPGPIQQRIFAETMHDLMRHNPQGALDGHTRIRCS